MTKERKSIYGLFSLKNDRGASLRCMNYKLLCTDIDGTLLNADREVSPATISQFNRIKNGCSCVLASSRMPDAMRHLQKDLSIEDSPLIAYNGGLVLAGNRVLTSMEIPLNIIHSIVAFSENTSVHISIYHADNWYVPTWDYWAEREANNTKVLPTIQPLTQTLDELNMKQCGAHKVMCMGPASEIAQVYQSLFEAFADELHVYKSKDTYLEIANKKISKKSAIQTLLDQAYPTLKWEEIIAFGDNYNDMEMLEAVGLGVAVSNAKPEVLAMADYVSKTNKEDGVALAIEKMVI